MFTAPAHSQRAGPLVVVKEMQERAELAGEGETELLGTTLVT